VKQAVWLAVVKQTTCTQIYIDWLEEMENGSYALAHGTTNQYISYGTLMHADVALDINHCLQPTLRAWLLQLHKAKP
jgi:hypothetical protein